MKKRAPKNRTLTCSKAEIKALAAKLIKVSKPATLHQITDRIICGNSFKVLPHLPSQFVKLLILDPPYNLSKNYNGCLFREKEKKEYANWFENLLSCVKSILKPNATVYVCSDWKTSLLIAPLLEKYFYVQNRITWEREKGRGAKMNWKNNTEDIWFCTTGNDYYFNVESVKLKKKVIAPYIDNGAPKDWQEETLGRFRLTHPSNVWTDITIPFWSMLENTGHPAQKPEKLIAKLILASSRTGDFVFDPFLGSGTTVVVSQKLQRHFCGIEQDQEYCCWGQKRLEQAYAQSAIQGYADGVFWERNSLNDQPKSAASANQNELSL